jgi:hypothetical protein
MSGILNTITRFFDKENPNLRKATAITRRKIEPLKNIPSRGTRRMAPYVRQRLTGRAFVPRGAEFHRVVLSDLIASNQANRLQNARKHSVTVKKRSRNRSSFTRRAAPQ